MNLGKLKKLLANYPDYRWDQVKRAVFQELITSWEEATALPVDLRTELAEEASLGINAKEVVSLQDETRKAVIKLEDGSEVETVLMPHKTRNTVCVSTQVGCSLNCKFCMTGKMGLVRNLEYWEMIVQALFFAREIGKIDNIVFMGMGEPFLNYEEFVCAAEFFNDEKTFNIGARNISVSTVGVVEGIKKLADADLQINLAVSLHAPTNELRSSLIPVNRKYPLEELFEAIDYYLEQTNRKVMFEYILLKDINDSKNDARRLANLMKGRLHFVNLINYNPTGEFQASSEEKKESFKKILENEGVKVGERQSFGEDIKGACGQLGKN